MPEKFPAPEGGNEEKSFAEIGDYRIEITLESARANIEQQFPDFKIESITSFDEEERGFGNAVFLVNGEYAFRFARHGKADRTLGVELQALPEIEKEVSLPIPHFEYVGRQKGTGLRFVGYRTIKGDPLRPEMVRDASGNIRPELAERIGQFFEELHAFSTERAKELGVPEVSLDEMYEVQLQQAREKLFPELDRRLPDGAQTLKAWVEKMFSDYLADPENFTYAPSVIHADLEFWHIRYDRERHDVSGIIDFGSMKISDPDYDLWRAYSHYGWAFVEKLLEAHPHPDPERLFKKLNFFWNAQMVRRAARPIAFGDEESIAWGLERLRERYRKVTEQ